jgi:hypothetical protein
MLVRWDVVKLKLSLPDNFHLQRANRAGGVSLPERTGPSEDSQTSLTLLASFVMLYPSWLLEKLVSASLRGRTVEGTDYLSFYLENKPSSFINTLSSALTKTSFSTASVSSICLSASVFSLVSFCTVLSKGVDLSFDRFGLFLTTLMT